MRMWRELCFLCSDEMEPGDPTIAPPLLGQLRVHRRCYDRENGIESQRQLASRPFGCDLVDEPGVAPARGGITASPTPRAA